MGIYHKMSSRIKSRASQKFRANHTYQHKMFADLVKSAKLTKSKFLFQREEEEMNSLCDVCPPIQSWTKEISQPVNTNLFTFSPVERSMTGLQQLHTGSSLALSGSSVFSLPESDQQTCQPNCQYLGTSHYSLYPDLLSLESSPEISSSESFPHESTPSSPESCSPESSSPESSSPESSSPSRLKSLKKSEGCLKFTFFTTCDSSLERQW